MENRAIWAGEQEKTQGVQRIGRKNGLELAVPSRERKGIGDVIYPDDRGYFCELARLGAAGIAERMLPGGGASVQISATQTYPQTIKAIHYHFEQTDLWMPISGMFQVILCDLRNSSATFGKVNTLYVGNLRPWAILIPPGVGHGYKIVGNDPGVLVYITNRFYNPEDEGRLPYDHPGIAYDWETQHK